MPDETSRWAVHGTRRVFTSEWVDVDLDDVEIPGGARFDHYVVRFPRTSVGAVVVDAGRVLLIWRHRFATDVWGWEIPAGWCEAGEELAVAAAREVEEETGYRIASVVPLTTFRPMSGISSQRHAIYLGSGALRVGTADPAEASRVEWFSLDAVRGLLTGGHVTDGPTLAALSFYLATHTP